MADVQATRVRGFFDTEDKAPASFELCTRQNHEGIHGILFVCPCGCGEIGNLPLNVTSDAQKPSWDWDGNEENPTLSPSVQRVGGCKWHVFLKKGVWIGA